MIGFAHVVLHLGLCNAIARVAPETSVAVRVRAINRIGDAQVDRVFHFERGEDSQKLVEFDSAQGVYRIDVSAPKYKCTASDYVMFLPDHNRNITETLGDRPVPPGKPMLIEGTVPQSFLYAKPSFLIFDKSVACKTPIGDPLPARMILENDQDAYYMWLYSNPAIDARGSVQLALKIGTATGQNHYIRVPIPFPEAWDGWPMSLQFNLDDGELDSLAADPINTLLCPKLFKTMVGG